MLVLFWDVVMLLNGTLLRASKFSLNMLQVLWLIKGLIYKRLRWGCAHIVLWEHTCSTIIYFIVALLPFYTFTCMSLYVNNKESVTTGCTLDSTH